jgi:hypothetical protein
MTRAIIDDVEKLRPRSEEMTATIVEQLGGASYIGDA